jgi:hypothetical protein
MIRVMNMELKINKAKLSYEGITLINRIVYI